ncbi:RecBCD enzyme subunit RecB [Paraconexibacter sp. AEG42_29]|uniref:RecBCD enzyme subunit RecB n=1 Tax=Paraconexibacter sp. AEG42_29 TaxID=2997339 RepID=A0AAU7B198_9ACTN
MSGERTLRSAVEPFDVLGPLPSGVAVLEASAGTGKTFTIAALAARYVAEGLVTLDQLLLVTFTRMATGELRERVRERLVSAERILGAVLDGGPVPSGDTVAALLADGTSEQVTDRRRNLARAVADFDAATITTTHGFCLEALGSLGFAGDVASDCAFVEDVGELIDEVVDDLYIRAFWQQATQVLSEDEARRVAREAIENPSAVLLPVSPLSPKEARDRPGEDKPWAMRARLANAAREVLAQRKRDTQVMTYDDLLTRLKATLEDPKGGPAVAERLRARYRVVLVDEFQDTDRDQWAIMNAAFGHPGGTLILIGDPKQAIYAFRGADVYSYLEAADAAVTVKTLAENWRSDQDLITAYDELFAGAQLGHENIVYRDVKATKLNRARRLHGAPESAPLRIRVVDRSRPPITLTQTGAAQVGSVREHIAADVANDIVRLLASGAEIDVKTDEHGGRSRRPVVPGDVAVLVRRNFDAATIRERLDAAGVPAVINGAGSVFEGRPAQDWLALLQALERPTSARDARAVALTAFLGWTAAAVAAADDAAWEGVHRRLHRWAHVLREAGVASLLETITLQEQLPPRVLRTHDGERELTDLRHIGQLLHRVATEEHLGVAALATWLRQRIAEVARETDEERSRRLESDAAAVQVLTIHRSKGLEFPVVYYPSLWDPSPIAKKGQPVFFHDPANGDRRTLDVGLDGSPDFQKHRVRHRDEIRGEDLRLAYVALTRAQHQAVVWWAGTHDSRGSALSRLLFDRGPGGAVKAQGPDRVQPDAAAAARLRELAAAAPGCIAVESSVPVRATDRWATTPPAAPALSAATLDRTIDRTWRRTSYSDITSAAHDLRVASEPEEGLVDDEPDADGSAPVDSADAASAAATADAALRAEPSLLADMPGGVDIGTLVHNLLEAADFAAPDLEAEVAARLAEQRARRALDVGDPAVVVAGLVAGLRTPLGPLADDLRLADLTRADRLDELAFELPLAGGETPTGVVTPGAIAAVLRRHLDPGDPLHGYADRLADPALRAALAGYLTGSIDLAFRVTSGAAHGGRPRFGIVDYKTNRLGDPLQPLTQWDHRPAAISAEMYRSHYALQGLLYTVALHRYLRLRVPGYDPATDIAGVFYLFMRGLAGPATPRMDGTPFGVFAWRPPGALVTDLSDLLERGASR